MNYRIDIRFLVLSRFRKGYTQAEMANIIDTSPTRYGKIERGESVLNILEAAQVCEVLGIKIDDLIIRKE